jgi:hypothetical protein
VLSGWWCLYIVDVDVEAHFGVLLLDLLDLGSPLSHDSLVVAELVLDLLLFVL